MDLGYLINFYSYHATAIVVYTFLLLTFFIILFRIVGVEGGVDDDGGSGFIKNSWT